jgi:hypothetical protein
MYGESVSLGCVLERSGVGVAGCDGTDDQPVGLHGVGGDVSAREFGSWGDDRHHVGDGECVCWAAECDIASAAGDAVGRPVVCGDGACCRRGCECAGRPRGLRLHADGACRHTHTDSHIHIDTCSDGDTNGDIYDDTAPDGNTDTSSGDGDTCGDGHINGDGDTNGDIYDDTAADGNADTSCRLQFVPAIDVDMYG